MKLIAFLMFIAAGAISGTPDQDLIVDIMRERFKAASPNLIEYDINLNQDWDCVYYNARKGIVPNYNKHQVLFNFERRDDYTYANKGSFPFNDFKFHEDGHFIGKTNSSVLYARKLKEDTLIFEYTGAQYKVRRSYVSVSNPKLAGHGYIYCKLK